MNRTIVNFEVKESKTGHPVPVVNGVHLHSSYNPMKEAESFVEKFSVQFGQNSNVLVFGLGFAYHIDRIIYSMRRVWGEQYKIVVIDPLLETEEALNKSREVTYAKNIVFHSGLTVPEIFDNRDIVDFLTLKPTVVPHTASFNLFQDYFKNFMSFKAKNEVSSMLTHIQDSELKDYLSSFGSESYDEVIKKIEEKRSKWNKWDHLLLSLNFISKPQNIISNQESINE